MRTPVLSPKRYALSPSLSRGRASARLSAGPKAGRYEDFFEASSCPRQFDDRFVVVAYEPIQLGLEQPLLIAVHAEARGSIFHVNRRADAEALDAPRAQGCHVRRPGAHRRQRDRVVDTPGDRLEHLVR